MTALTNAENTLQALLTLLARSKFSWLSTVRPDGRPHIVPIWHVMVQENIYFATASRSVKVVNIHSNPNAVVAAYLDNPESGLIVEGYAKLRPDLRESVSKFFEQKYEWNIKEDDEYDALIEVEPTRLIAWGQHGEGRWSGTDIRKIARGGI
jgi:general stress protein 26